MFFSNEIRLHATVCTKCINKNESELKTPKSITLPS